MQHIDEHTLELFVLNSAGVTKRRQEIEAHIAECHGCRELVSQISAFYKEAGMEFEKHPKEAPVSENTLVRSRNELKPVFEPINSPPVSYRPITAMQKFVYFTRMHPVAVGSTSILCVATLALFLNGYLTGKPQNPKYMVADGERGSVKIVTSDNAILWEWVTENQDEIAMHQQIAIQDLDKDGTNEIVTTLRLGESRTGDIIELKEFDAQRNLIRHKNFNREVNYPGRNYSSSFSAGRLLVGDFSGAGNSEIIVHARNVPRSPAILVHLDAEFNEIGAFWHFGDIDRIASIDIDHDGAMEIFAGGVNDLADSVRGEFAVLIIIDPRKIVAQKRASIASVLDLPVSNAELYYLRFPISSMDSVMQSGPGAKAVQNGNDGQVYVSVGGGRTTTSQFNFDYVFDRDMRALEVKSNNGTDRVFEDLRRDGKITGLLNAAYLENLRQGVRYWDGKEWKKEMVRVNASHHEK